MRNNKPDWKWVKTKKVWRKQNPPNHEGYYVCGICRRWVHESEMTLDHIKPKGAYPKLKYTLSNLQPAHWLCNYKKGSKPNNDGVWAQAGANA